MTAGLRSEASDPLHHASELIVSHERQGFASAKPRNTEALLPAEARPLGRTERGQVLKLAQAQVHDELEVVGVLARSLRGRSTSRASLHRKTTFGSSLER